MMCKMGGMVAFLVLGCILAGAQERHYEPALSKDPIGPLKWAPPAQIHNHKLRVDKTYLCLGWGSDKPLDITSKRVNFKAIPNGKKVIFEENVKVKQGDVTLTCDRLVIVYGEKSGERTKKLSKALENASQMKSISASGNVKIVQNERMAVADKVFFDNGQRSIILKGNPALLRDGLQLLKDGQIIIIRDENGTEHSGNSKPGTGPIREKK
jgi:lipopolysaccharide export system protein LptA